METVERGTIKIWTVGHSNHSLEHFLQLLNQSPKITHLIDVRTTPMSSYSPQFNRQSLEAGLLALGITYVHLKGLGGRPSEDFCYTEDGRVIYDALETTTEYVAAYNSLKLNAANKICVLMCSCGTPDNCHRNLSIGFKLQEDKFEVIDILPDGSRVKSHPPIVHQTLFGEKEYRKSKLPVRRATLHDDSSL